MIQKVNDMNTQVLNDFFSVSDIMEAVRGHLCFYDMNATILVEPILLKLKTCSLFHENLLLQTFNDMYTQVLI